MLQTRSKAPRAEPKPFLSHHLGWLGRARLRLGTLRRVLTGSRPAAKPEPTRWKRLRRSTSA